MAICRSVRSAIVGDSFCDALDSFERHERVVLEPALNSLLLIVPLFARKKNFSRVVGPAIVSEIQTDGGVVALNVLKFFDSLEGLQATTGIGL